MKKTYKVKIGDRYFRAGIIKDVVKAAAYQRLLDRDKSDALTVIGYPLHYAFGTWQQELFKGPEVRILQARLEGRGLVGREKFDVYKALEDMKKATGLDLTQLRGAIKMPARTPMMPIRKTLPIKVDYDVRSLPPLNPGIAMKQLYHLATLRQISDSVIRYVHAKAHPDGPFFLWKSCPQHKYLGKWNRWGQIIRDNLMDVYRRLKIPGCLDIVALHKDEDWIWHKRKMLEAFDNARNPDFMSIQLEPLLIDKKAYGLVYERTEPKKAPPTEIKVKKLFVPVTEEEEEE